MSMTLEESDHALPLTDMDPTPRMKETPSPDANDISTRFFRLENLVEMIAMHMGLVEPKNPCTTLEDLSAASESPTSIEVEYLGDVEENVNEENVATP